MKRNIIFLLSFCMAMLTSCLSDDSSVGDPANFKDVAISGIEPSYMVTSYVGQHLTIAPKLETELTDNELTNKWMIARNPVVNYGNEKPDSFHLIGTERNLDYEIKLTPGTYTLKYEVSESNGYTVSSTSTLTVTTSFLNALYVLKETSDGNTDVDFAPLGGSTVENVLSRLTFGGKPMEGKPLYLSVGYFHNFLTEDAKNSSGTLLCVTTESGGLEMVRTDDFGPQIDRSNVSYQPLDSDEKPIGVWLNIFSEVFLTNKGSRWTYSSEQGPASGKYGTVSLPTGASTYWAFHPANWGYMVYWDEQNGHFCTVDFNGGPAIMADQASKPFDFSDYTCVGGGCNYVQGQAVFALQNKKTDERSVYGIAATSIEKLCTIPAGNVTAKCQHLSFNVNQATIAYGTDGKDIYAVDFTNGDERKLTVQGLPSGETITYVSNQCFVGKAANVDYLAVGTQTADGKYTLSFYKMLGGAPDGAPVQVMKGTGKIKCVRYVAPSFNSMSDNLSTTD